MLTMDKALLIIEAAIEEAKKIGQPMNIAIVDAGANPANLATDPRGQFAAALPVLKFQMPRYEHTITRHGAAMIGDYLERWVAPSFTSTPAFEEYSALCRDAMRIPRLRLVPLHLVRRKEAHIHFHARIIAPPQKLR